MGSTHDRQDGPPPQGMTRVAAAARVIGIGVATVSGLGLLVVTLVFLFIGVMFGDGGGKILPALPFLGLSLIPLASAALFVAAGAPLTGRRGVRHSDRLGHAAMSVLFLIQPAADLLRAGMAVDGARPDRALEGEAAQVAWLSALAAVLALCHLVVAVALWRLPRLPTEG